MTRHASFAARPLILCVIAIATLGVGMRVHSAPPKGDPTLPTAEWKAIKKVIADQRAALKTGDAAKAFAQASPGIRAQFESPEKFLAMVRTAYDALLAARYVEFLEGAVIEGNVIQPLRLIAPDNSVQVALYTMEKQKDGRWKISGCVLAPSTVQAV
ncbi:MAG: DUF4864 domain-containing protein [Casimicrobiaceae bacterium]